MSISIETKLAILQQSEYEWPKYQKWLKENKNLSVVVKPKSWTLKLRLLRLLAPFMTLSVALMLLEVPKMIIVQVSVSLATLKLRSLQRQGLIVVAIAGSYGKTSTKYIAEHVLRGSKRVLMTPENINTPIGIARLILSTLNSTHEIFIAELGEYYTGDIASLTRFLSPDYKILTPVGFAHLERFGTEENLRKGLEELVTTQPKKGKSFVFGKDYSEKNIQNVVVSRAGTEFSHDGRSYFIPLFGSHNAVNCLPSLWLCHEFGINATDRLATIPFIPHRLEPTQLERNILLLDNGYNANPGSTKETFEVMRALDGSQKIIFTPGYVDMGEFQEKENEKLGDAIAKVADLCVVIEGVNSTAILRGLEKAHFDPQSIVLAPGEKEGMDMISGRVKPSAIILFENSIPELYKS